MEKKIETSKPILNRTRRQLLLGAGLTPVVMTLHAAKVMADEGLHENPSGLAPFSGALKASAYMTADGVTSQGTDASELLLYKAICNNTDTRLRPYYGSIGNGNADPANTITAWSYGEKGTMGAGTPGNWTEEYEKNYVGSVNTTYMTETNVTSLNSIREAIAKLAANEREVVEQTTVNTLKDAESSSGLPSITIPEGAAGFGVFKYITNAKGLLSGLVSSFNTAAATYNHNQGDLKSGDVGYVPSLIY